MNGEERRVRVLRLLGSNPNALEYGAPLEPLVSKVCLAEGVGSRTARTYLLDLTIRKWARVALGRVYLTRAGRDVLAESDRKVTP